MMGMTGASASDFDKALALITALADLEATKQRIAQIREAEDAAKAAMVALDQERKTINELHLHLNTETKKRAGNLDAREGEIEARENDLNRQRAELQRDKDAWIMVDAALKDDRKKLDEAKARHNAEVTAAEDAIFARNSALDAQVLKLEAKEQELNARELAMIDKETALEERLKLFNEATRKIRE